MYGSRSVLRLPDLNLVLNSSCPNLENVPDNVLINSGIFHRLFCIAFLLLRNRVEFGRSVVSLYSKPNGNNFERRKHNGASQREDKEYGHSDYRDVFPRWYARLGKFREE